MKRAHSKTVLASLLLLLPLTVMARQEVLPPEQVFRYAVRAAADKLTVSWDIEPGYYMYQERMSYAFEDPALTLGEPDWPAGEMHSDEFFGEQMIYRGRVSIDIPLTMAQGAPAAAELIVRSQGCADYGLCYPPQTWRTQVKLAAPAAASPLSDAIGKRPGRSLFGQNSDEPLPLDEAFVPSVIAADAFTLEVRWDIAPGYYLYKHSFAVSHPDDRVQLGKLEIPAGKLVNDLEYGETEVFYDSVVIRVPLSRGARAAQRINLQLDYQGCKEDSICYPPDQVALSVLLPEATTAVPETISAPVSEQDRLFGVVIDASLPTMMFVFLGLGLLLAFTPCCLPMVPILSGIIAGQGNNVTTMRSFWLSLSYVLGMAFTYTVAGAIFGAAGNQIQAALQTPLILGAVATLFVVLSLAMFGVYELQLPASWQTRLSALGTGSKAGSFAGTAVMGAISALVVSTCVAPPLVAALAVIAQTGDVARGALALFALSMGMGIPLLIYGTSAGKLLPKAGPWMNTIKAIFGFMLLGLAIWMLDRVLPSAITMLLWAALIIFAGVWMGALRKRAAIDSRSDLWGKVVGMLAVFYGALILVGAWSGATNPLNPLNRLSGTPDMFAELPFEPIKSVNDFEAARLRAAAADKPLMLDFYADWCVSCKEMEHFTFTDPAVQAALADAVLIQADVTANDEVDQELLRHFGIYGPPTIVFFDRDGREIESQRVIGYQDTEAFMTTLDYVLR